jgi:hypothetical protein
MVPGNAVGRKPGREAHPQSPKRFSPKLVFSVNQKLFTRAMSYRNLRVLILGFRLNLTELFDSVQQVDQPQSLFILQAGFAAEETAHEATAIML